MDQTFAQSKLPIESQHKKSTNDKWIYIRKSIRDKKLNID